MPIVKITGPISQPLVLDRGHSVSITPLAGSCRVQIPGEGVSDALAAASSYGPYSVRREVVISIDSGVVEYDVDEAGGGSGQASVSGDPMASAAAAGLIVAIGGQSNAEGNGPPHSLQYELPSPSVLAVKKDGMLQVATEPLHSRAGWDQPNYPAGLTSANTGYPCHSFGLRAGKEIAAATGMTVTLLPCALGSTAMAMWAPPATDGDRSTLFGAMKYRAQQARPKKPVPDLILWMGHESDAASATVSDFSGAESGTGYRTSWTGLVNNLRSKFGASVPIIYVQLCQYNDAANYGKHNHAGEVQRRMESGYGTNTAVSAWRPSMVPMHSAYATYTGVSGGNTAAPAADNDADRAGNKYRIVCTGTGSPQVYLAKHVAGVRYKVAITAITAASGVQVMNDGTAIASGQTFTEGRTREYTFTAASVGLGILVNATAADFTFTIDEFEALETGDFAGHYMVVSHDLPLSDQIHISAEGQRELGRRIGLVYQERVLGRPVNGSGPRLVSITKTSSTTLKVKFNRAIQEDLNNYGNGTTTLFRAYQAGVQQTISTAVRDASDTTALIITLSAALTTGTVTVSYGDRQGEAGVWRRGVVRDADGLPAPMFRGVVAA